MSFVKQPMIEKNIDDSGHKNEYNALTHENFSETSRDY